MTKEQFKKAKQLMEEIKTLRDLIEDRIQIKLVSSLMSYQVDIHNEEVQIFIEEARVKIVKLTEVRLAEAEAELAAL